MLHAVLLRTLVHVQQSTCLKYIQVHEQYMCHVPVSPELRKSTTSFRFGSRSRDDGVAPGRKESPAEWW